MAGPAGAGFSARLGGWAAAGLFAAFVPAHLYTFRVVGDRPGLLAAAAVRLVLQVPMITAAWRVARGR